MNELVNVLNVKTGQTGVIRRRLFDNPAFNNGTLVEVHADVKPYVAELYREQTVEEFTENHPDKVVLPVVETALTRTTQRKSKYGSRTIAGLGTSFPPCGP